MFCLVIQIRTEIFRAMHCTPRVDLSFASVEHIVREATFADSYDKCMLIASMISVVVYIHVFRGLYFGSYTSPRHLVGIPGVQIHF
jgi:ubiquinol-cytochrome c reductase cytochrome b subunit